MDYRLRWHYDRQPQTLTGGNPEWDLCESSRWQSGWEINCRPEHEKESPPWLILHSSVITILPQRRAGQHSPSYATGAFFSKCTGKKITLANLSRELFHVTEMSKTLGNKKKQRCVGPLHTWDDDKAPHAHYTYTPTHTQTGITRFDLPARCGRVDGTHTSGVLNINLSFSGKSTTAGSGSTDFPAAWAASSSRAGELRAWCAARRGPDVSLCVLSCIHMRDKPQSQMKKKLFDGIHRANFTSGHWLRVKWWLFWGIPHLQNDRLFYCIPPR